ncbi:uncharacterized protein BKA78DRAFT_140555 [Phyllosticta capitalensis]|uniref:uncharacterized protein n=1 Tax=Phyllosticta capitalensis TaxID=121624 RepID=UPI00312EACE4
MMPLAHCSRRHHRLARRPTDKSPDPLHRDALPFPQRLPQVRRPAVDGSVRLCGRNQMEWTRTRGKGRALEANMFVRRCSSGCEKIRLPKIPDRFLSRTTCIDDFLRFFLETGIDQIQRHVLDESLVIHRTISADGHATANRSRHSCFAAFTTQQNPFLGLFTD